MIVCRFFLSTPQKILTSPVCIRKMQPFSLYLRNTEFRMQEFIASYLFQNKTCPLPGLGTLAVHRSGAEADFSNKLIAAPQALIQFNEVDTDTADFLTYVISTTEHDSTAVTNTFNMYFDRLKNDITEGQNVSINQVGSFAIDSQRKIIFTQEPLPAVYTQSVLAERVIHPQAEHQMLVGDKETTNTYMTEMLAPKEAETDRWWIWAIVLGVIGLGLLVIYFSGAAGVSMFGNTTKI